MSRTRTRSTALTALLTLAFAGSAAGAPLNLSNLSARQVLVEFENSITDPSIIATSRGSPVLASYSVSGGVGTVEIAIPEWEAARTEGTAYVADRKFKAPFWVR